MLTFRQHRKERRMGGGRIYQHCISGSNMIKDGSVSSRDDDGTGTVLPHSCWL